MDTYPVPARSLGRYFKIDGCTLARNYKEHLSDYREWDQRDHASEWVLLSKNMGTHLSIDESMHSNDLFTFLSNKDGHGKRGTLIAAVRGTKVSDVVKQLKKIPIAQRNAVEEVTMDFSDSMYAIVKAVFPNASIVIDCFHIVKRLCDGLDEMRMRFKRKATSEVKQAERDFKKKRAVRAKARADYREKHP
ncbi:MAG: transposase, partial [Rikenellaceae bacterium]